MPSRIAKTSKSRSSKKKENSHKNEDDTKDEFHDLSTATSASVGEPSSLCNRLSNELKDSTNTMNVHSESLSSTALSPSTNKSLLKQTEITNLAQINITTTTASSNNNNKNKKQTATKKPRQRKHLMTHHNVSLNQSHNTSFAKSNKKITDYFQIRKSSRKCKSDLEKEKRMVIETAIKTMKEEGLEVRQIENKGRGVFATKKFYRGDFVCEYAGEMISYQQAKKREEIYAQDSNIGCYMYFFEYKSKSYCIDATAESGRLGRLLNHSKLGGNCHTKLFEINTRPYLILVASKDIHPGEEMTYDYGDRNKMSLESHPWLAE